MTTAMIFASIILLGLGCGLGCGSVTTPFLLGRLLGEGKTVKESMKAVSIFSFGKIVTLAILGLVASMFGLVVLDSIESIYPNITLWVIRIMTFSFGAFIVYSALKKSKCQKCKNCIVEKKSIVDSSSYLLSGVIYAIIPCTPLVTSLTYASTMTPILGFVLLLIFGIANSIIPILIYSPIIGIVNTKILSDVPQFAKAVKIIGGILLIILPFFIS